LNLRRTNDYLENIFENSPDGIGIVDREGKFLKWNRRAAELYGYTLEELKDKTAFDLYADKDQLEKMMTELRAEGTVKKARNEHDEKRRHSGRLRDIDRPAERPRGRGPRECLRRQGPEPSQGSN